MNEYTRSTYTILPLLWDFEMVWKDRISYWNVKLCDATEEIILWNIKMNIHSCLICGFNNTEKLCFTCWVYLWSYKYMECHLCFVNLWIDSHFIRGIYTVPHQKSKKRHNCFKHVVFLSIQKLKCVSVLLSMLMLMFVGHSQK